MASKPTGQPDEKSRPPWYASGLDFECQSDCGVCCSDHDDYSVVYVEPGDLERLADHFDMTRDGFRRRYCADDDGDLVLRMDGPDCPFLDGNRCTVYPARPVQCSTFPFWKENLRSLRNWVLLCGFCPGIDVGERHDLHTIEAHLRARRPKS